MSTTSNRILSIYKSRKTILEILEYQNYGVDEYNNFSINEIDAMYKNKQLDMLLTHESNNTKIYVKYCLDTKQLKQQLDNFIEDLYTIENILTKKDTLIIIMDDDINDTTQTRLKYLFDHDGIFIVLHNIKRLQFNILNHTLVPACSVLNEEELKELKEKYSIKQLSQLPEISRFDPQALAMCLRPGKVCKFERDSMTALKYNYYRVCV
jgi:DNA-directed RNA polymerase subunit H (RpoH/RPB5)